MTIKTFPGLFSISDILKVVTNISMINSVGKVETMNSFDLSTSTSNKEDDGFSAVSEDNQGLEIGSDSNNDATTKLPDFIFNERMNREYPKTKNEESEHKNSNIPSVVKNKDRIDTDKEEMITINPLSTNEKPVTIERPRTPKRRSRIRRIESSSDEDDAYTSVQLQNDEAMDSFDSLVSASNVDEDDPALIRKTRVSRLLEDDDDETAKVTDCSYQNEEVNKEVPEMSTELVEKENSKEFLGVSKEEDIGDDSNEVTNNSPASIDKMLVAEVHKSILPKKRGRRILLESSGDEDDDGPSVQSQKGNCLESTETVMFKNNSAQSDVNKPDTHSVETVRDLNDFKERLKFIDDVFDAEESDEDELGNFTSARCDELRDEGMSLNAIKKSAKQIARGNKDQNALPKRQRKRTDLTELHSESQRIVREARIKLPYHVPEQRTLDDFLNRKKSVPLVLKPTKKETTNILLQYTSFSSKQKKSCFVRKLDLDKDQHTTTVVEETAATVLENQTDCNQEESEFRPVCKDTLSDLPELNKISTDIVEQGGDLNNEKLQCKDDKLVSLSEVQLNSAVPQQTPLIDGGDHSADTAIFEKLDELVVTEKRHEATSHTPKIVVPSDIVPKLNGTPNMEICLEGDDSPRKTGVNSLIHRFMIHTAPMRAHCEPSKVEMSILKKAKDSTGEEILTTEKLMVPTGQKPDIFDDVGTPGAKFTLLKDSLRAQIVKKRIESIRLLLSEKEKAKEINDAENCDEEENEEEEMSETSESESEEDDNEEDYGLLENKRKRHSNVFIDDEAEEDDDGPGSEDDNSTLGLEISHEDHIPRDRFPEDDCHSTIDVPPTPLPPTINKITDDSECEDNTARLKNQSTDGSVDTSFEIVGSLIPGHQPGGGMLHQKSSLSSTSIDIETLLKKTTSLPLPFEESQDYRGMLTSQSVDTAEDIPTQLTPLRFAEEFNTQSSMEMFPSTSVQGTSRLGIDNPEVSTQENMAELYNLCSGTWSMRDHANKGIEDLCDPPTQTDTQRNMDELLDLCSGQFPDSHSVIARVSRVEEERAFQSFPHFNEIHKSKLSDDELSVSSFKMDITRRGKRTRLVMSDDSDNDNETDVDKDIDLEVEEDVKNVNMQKKRVLEYFEDEAELSGSDASSDEDEDLGEDDDVLEEELGDLEEYSEDEIKDQVGRVHMKMMMDDDQRRLRLFKEMYLEDGDLHSDGQGRIRKFRWRNIGKDEENGEVRESDSEAEETETTEAIEFRVKRHEREKWLSEQHRTLENEMDDDMKFTNVKKKILMQRWNSMDSTNSSNNPVHSDSARRIAFRGSFLTRSKETLAKIARLTKGLESENSNGPRNSRNFVFAAVSPEKVDEPPAKMRRMSSNPSGTTKKPALAKRLSLPCQGFGDGSIFNLF